MSPPGPSDGSGAGGAGAGGVGDGGVEDGRPQTSAALSPADARRFTSHLDDLERSVAEARDALRRLAETPLATGGGQDNAAIAAWYRDLLAADAAPAADELARELDAVRRAVGEGAAAWEETEGRAAEAFTRDPADPPG